MSNSFPSDSKTARPVSEMKGNLKVYLGYAAGVGKTYQMLEEARALRSTGTDVVVGYYEPHARPETANLLVGLESIPLRGIEYRGTKFTEMDPEAIVQRQPQVALVDEFPHSNVPGSERTKRWEDVLFLLGNGIDVWTTMNVQHLESLNDKVEQISGAKIRETIPDWVVQQASEVVMVDLAPRALLNRLDRGVIYQGQRAQSAKKNFFKESTLVALREFALRETAFEVRSRHDSVTVDESEPEHEISAARPDFPRFPTERVLVLLTPHPSAAALVRRGKRVADYFKGECIAIAVCPGGCLESLSETDRKSLEKHLKFAQDLHVSTHLLSGENTAEEFVSFAHRNDVTQIYVSRSKSQSWFSPFKPDLIQRIIRLSGDIEITIVAERERRPIHEK
jgi:two-component system sensor histidine kinase KdpD